MGLHHVDIATVDTGRRMMQNGLMSSVLPRHLRLLCHHLYLQLLLVQLLGCYVEGLKFVTEPSGGIVVAGSPFWFHCQAEDASNTMTYLWRFGEADVISNTALTALSNRVVYPNGTLLIKEVRKEDEGEYACVASSTGNSLYSRPVALRLAYISDAFKINPQNITVELGRSATLQCDIDSLPIPQYTWRRNGLDLDPMTATSGQGQTGKVLQLSSVKYSDGGVYLCMALNGVLRETRLSSPAHVTVVGGPVMVSRSRSHSVPVSHDVQLDCPVTSLPPASLSWFRLAPSSSSSSSSLDNASFVPVQLSERVAILDNRTLVIHNATSFDSATYRCVATNQYGQATLEVILIVAGGPEQPMITRGPENQTLTAGQSLVLNCTATGNPTPLVTWTKGSSEALATGPILQINKVAATDSGTYHCVASNSAGTSTVAALVTILYPPQFVKKPQNRTVSVGQTVQFPCAVMGEPPPLLQWITPKSVILPVSHQTGRLSVDTQGTLTLSSVVPQDHGRYTCFASSHMGSITAVVWLTVTGPPYFTAQPQSRVALQEETTTFSCHVTGYPAPEVTWYRGNKQERPLHQSSRLLLSPYGDLTLVAVTLSDDGVYTCVGNNSLGRVKAFAVLTVHVPPTFVVAPASQSVLVGATVQLRCRVRGVPVPSQRWLWAGETLTMDDNMMLDSNQTLTISNIRSEQLGQYTCVAHNQAGQRAVSASIHFSGNTGQPYFTQQPMNATANLTDSLTLSCRAAQSTGDATLTPAIRWYRGLRQGGASILIDTIHRDDGEGNGVLGGKEVGKEGGLGRYWATEEGDLVFERVQAEDKGWYYCTAANREAVIYADPVYIRVQVAPTIRTISNPPPTAKQAPVNLTCNAEGDPDPAITWRSPGGQEVKDSIEGYGLDGGVLMIQGAANEKDGGSWVCVACNVLGCDTADTYLGVEGKPVIRKVDAEQNATTIHIICVTVGLPAPGVAFTSEGAKVSESRDHFVMGGHMYIHKAWLKSQYVCTAQNVYGTVSVTMSVPQSPGLLGARPSPTTVTLTLSTIGKLGALPLEGIVVEYRESKSNEWTSKYILQKQSKNDDHANAGFIQELKRPRPDNISMTSAQGDNSDRAGNLEVTVAGLVPYTIYLMHVRLVNVLGEGPLSDSSVRFFTLPHAPPPPENVTVTSENRQIVVTWRVPEHLNGNIDNILFKVQVANSSGLAVAQSSLPAIQGPKVVVTDLDIGNHSVTMTTVNSHLQLSSVNVTRLVLVTQTVPKFVPAIVNATAINDTALMISWQTPPEEAGDPSEPPVEGYVVRAQSAALTSPVTARVSGVSVHWHVLSGLQERTLYNCSVAAYNSGGTGLFSPSVDVLTFYSLFSRGAYKSDTTLALSGMWIAVLGGCLGGAVCVVIVVWLVCKWRTLQHGSRLDLLQSSHGLDQFYLENPKGLYSASRWSTVRWLRGFDIHRVFSFSTSATDVTNTKTTSLTNHNEKLDSSTTVNDNSNTINVNAMYKKRNENGGRRNDSGSSSSNNNSNSHPCSQLCSRSNDNNNNDNNNSNGNTNAVTPQTEVSNNDSTNARNRNNSNTTNTTTTNKNNNSKHANSSPHNNNRAQSYNTNATTSSNNNNSNNNNNNNADITSTNNNSNNNNSNINDTGFNASRRRREVTVVAMEAELGGGGGRGGGADGRGKDDGGEGKSNNRRWWNQTRLRQLKIRLPSVASILRKSNQRKTNRAPPAISHPHFSGHGATVVTSVSSALSGLATRDGASESSQTPSRSRHHNPSPSTPFSLHFSQQISEEWGDFPDGVSLSSASDSVATVTGNMGKNRAQREACQAKGSGDLGDRLYEDDSVVYESISECGAHGEACSDDRSVAKNEDSVQGFGCDLDMFSHRKPMNDVGKKISPSAGSVAISLEPPVKHSLQDQNKAFSDIGEKVNPPRYQLWWNDSITDTDVSPAGKRSTRDRNVASTDDNPTLDNEEVTSTDGTSVTVTDGDSVYHILHRLDQDLEDYMVTETLESSLEVNSLDSSSLAEVPCGVLHTDLDHPLSSCDQTLALDGDEPRSVLHTDLDQTFTSSAQTVIFDNAGPFLYINDEALDMEDTFSQSESQLKCSPTEIPQPKYRTHLGKSPHKVIHFPVKFERLTKREQVFAESRHLSPKDVHRQETGRRESVSDRDPPRKTTASEDRESIFTQSDVNNASSYLSPRFNAELHSYEVNPCHSLHGDTIKPIHLYTEGFQQTGSKGSSHPSDHWPLSTSPERRGRVSSHCSKRVDSGERRALEELVSTLHVLQPANRTLPEKAMPAARPKFFSVQRKKHLKWKDTERNSPTFFTLRRNQSSMPWIKSDQAIGSIRSRDSTPTNHTQRRFSMEMALPTGLTKLTWPAHQRHMTGAGTNTNLSGSPGQWVNSSPAPKLGTWKDTSSSSGNTKQTSRQGSHQEKNLWWRSLFKPHDKRSFQSPSLTSCVSWREKDHGADNSEQGEVMLNSSSPAVTCPRSSEDVVFGVNNVGYETANLF